MSIQPIGAPTLPTTQVGGLMPATTTLPAAAPTAAQKSFPLDALLQTGVQVAAQVGAVRQATGARASRQQRIAACGRKPFCIATRNCKRKKEAYRQCVAQAESGGVDNRSVFVPPPQAPQQSNTMTYVLIGLGVLLVGGVTIFLLRRK